ncbi:putative dsRNA-binding protein [Ensifer sp. ENS12]|uniref:putative dsRNA-binding protein n=1 Tax=Ensifer sp. ENS12 TaxID=2854774 RepID=UPI001C47FB5F|nr:putative dsRNA-binding protein [Ensifer sp. ENS12]MBV7522590.1 hypothetical protein [Ensifer sp. ENS12]
MNDTQVPDIHNLISELIFENSGLASSPEHSSTVLSSTYRAELARFQLEVENFSKRINTIESFQEYVKKYYKKHFSCFREKIAYVSPTFASVLLGEHEINVLHSLDEKSGLLKKHFLYADLYPIYGNLLFKFSVSRYISDNAVFSSFSPGLLSPILHHLTKKETVNNVWIALGFAPPISRWEGLERKTAILDSFHKLISYLSITSGEGAVTEFIRSRYMPLVPVDNRQVGQIIFGDYKTLTQELAHKLGWKQPHYSFERAGGTDHTPMFKCRVEFERLGEVEVLGSSKHETGQLAAAAVLDKVAADQKLAPQLRSMIKARYFERRQKLLPAAYTRTEIGPIKRLHEKLPYRMSDKGALAAFTLRADKARGAPSNSNERSSFFGSVLEAYLTVRPPGERFTQRSAIRPSVAQLIGETHAEIVGWHKSTLSERQRRDIAQSLLYQEYLERGMDAAVELFEKVFARRPVTPRAGAVQGDYDPSISYTTALQEAIHKRGNEPPAPIYTVLTEQNQSHDPRFKCSITYERLEGIGVDRNKISARNRASYALLKKLLPEVESR